MGEETHKMTLQEMLNSPEAKKMYRELAMKYHPDKGGDIKTMQKITALKNSKEVKDVALKRLYKDLISEKKPKTKSEYDDIKEPEDVLNYQDLAHSFESKINKEFSSAGVSFYFIVRKFGKILNLMVNIKWPEGYTSSFVMSNIRKYKTKEEFYRAILDFVKKRV